MNPIREAAARVKGHWYQGGYRDDNGNACGLGHLIDVMSNGEMHDDDFAFSMNPTIDSPAILMKKVATELFPERFPDSDACSFAIFNDHPDTTEDEVIAVMEKAAVIWDEKV